VPPVEEKVMRLAIISDIHGNRTAFEAVLADLRKTSPDLVLHGGDLADGGAAPAEIVDRVRELGWQGVAGNADEMLYRPESLAEFASQSPSLGPLFEVVAEMAAASREALGEERLAWLRGLPRIQTHGRVALVHASPSSTPRAMRSWSQFMLRWDRRLPYMHIFITHTFGASRECVSRTPEASVFLTMAIAGPRTSWWMIHQWKSGASSMTWKWRLGLLPHAGSHMRIGLRRVSKALALRGRD
jgi:predicted phosphodiesterase